MGLLQEPREKGLAGKPAPTIFDRVVKWKRVKRDNKAWKSTKKVLKQGLRETIDYAKDL